MAKKHTRRTPRPASRAKLGALERALADYSERVAHVEHAIELNIRRMGAMQAEIDHLRSMMRS